MIKFFRNIRQNMLKENRTSKTSSPAGRYFLYAIGEIILVVIGILIALKVNNWNEEQKRLQNRKVITKSIIEDLKKDSTNLKAIANRLKNDSITFKSIEQRLQLNKLNYDTIRSLYRNDFRQVMSFSGNFKFNNGTVNKMVNNDRSLYPKSIEDNFIYLLQTQEWFAYINELFIENFYQFMLAGQSYPTELLGSIDPGAEIQDLIWEGLDNQKMVTDFVALINWKMGYTIVAAQGVDRLQRINTLLLASLRELEE